MAQSISTIDIQADSQRVWDSLTQPSLVKLWQFGSDLLTSWKPGDNIEFVTLWESQTFRQWGKVLEFTPSSRLSYTLFAPRPGLEDKPENHFIMTYELSASNGTTHLRIIKEDNRPGAVSEPDQGEKNPVLAGLKKVCEESA